MIVVFVVAFWVCAIAFIVLEAEEKTGIPQTTVLKALPAFFSVAFVVSTRPSDSLFYWLLAAALFFCALGDIGMEYDLLLGLGMFLFGHIFIVANFIIHSIPILSSISILTFISVLSVMLVYSGLFHRYLLTSPEPAPLIRAVDIYAITISLTLSAVVLLWISSGSAIGFIPVIGALLFVISDSLIGVREFHHRFRFDEPLTMATYYSAIFLLAMSALVYVF